ncbi:MAG: poly-beta-1,6-N-acetyl-D-glucosamine N-deacetylase PgaB [Acinetobacter sp.]
MRHLLPVLLSSVLGSPFIGITSLSHAQVVQSNLKENESIALNFHDVRDDVLKQGDRDVYAINTQNLAKFFDWLSHSDWHPVTLKQISDARAGKIKLPKNAILLSFDDGTLSGYTHVYPLLKQYQLPAVFAIVTSWTDGKNDGGTKAYGQGNFMTWAQMREMQQSGLVEFTSHSDALHQGILANPQGNEEPAAITRQYFKSLQRYETDQEFEKRIAHDLTSSKQILERQLGVNIQAIIWPYGAVSPEVEHIAKNVGLPLSFSLGRSGINNIYDGTLKRLLITNNPESEDIRQELFSLVQYPEQSTTQIRHAVGLDLTDLTTLSMAKEEQQLGVLLERIKALSVQRVFVDAVTYDQHQWKAYFPNHYLPVKKDVLNRFVWQAQTRIASHVFVNFPFLFDAQPDVLQGLVLDMMKNNTGVAGVQFDLGQRFQKLWEYPQQEPLKSQWLEELKRIANIKKAAQQYSNVSNSFKLSVHQNLNANNTIHIGLLLKTMLQYVDFAHLTLQMPLQKIAQQQLLQQLNALDANSKQNLAISFDLNESSTQKDLKQTQQMMILLQQAGIQNIGVDHYRLKNSQNVQNYLYDPLSLNDSPLSYENPFRFKSYVEKHQ